MFAPRLFVFNLKSKFLYLFVKKNWIDEIFKNQFAEIVFTLECKVNVLRLLIFDFFF